MDLIQIGNKTIGDSSTFIIAEAGVNHNGSLEKALQLVDAAHSARADAIKFQTWKVEELYIPDEITGKDYQKSSKTRCLSYNDFKKIKQHCGKKGLIFLSTPDEEKSADFLESINVPAFKIGSAELNNHPFLEYIAKKNKPIMLSVGMASQEEIKASVDLIKKYNKNLILLQCVSSYPTPLTKINLKIIQDLNKKYNCISGLSDHTENPITPSLAVAAGAKVIEKHLTVDKNWEGPDNKMSLNQEEFRGMVALVRITELTMGDGIKKLEEIELSTKDFAKKCIVANQDLKKGTKLERSMVTFKRPFLGLEPNQLNKVLGKELQINLKKDNPLKLEDLK